MSPREQVATMAMNHLLRYIQPLSDLHEVKRAGQFVNETYLDLSKPIPVEMTYAEFLAAYNQWKAGQK